MPCPAAALIVPTPEIKARLREGVSYGYKNQKAQKEHRSATAGDTVLDVLCKNSHQAAHYATYIH